MIANQAGRFLTNGQRYINVLNFFSHVAPLIISFRIVEQNRIIIQLNLRGNFGNRSIIEDSGGEGAFIFLALQPFGFPPTLPGVFQIAAEGQPVGYDEENTLFTEAKEGAGKPAVPVFQGFGEAAETDKDAGLFVIRLDQGAFLPVEFAELKVLGGLGGGDAVDAAVTHLRTFRRPTQNKMR